MLLLVGSEVSVSVSSDEEALSSSSSQFSAGSLLDLDLVGLAGLTNWDIDRLVRVLVTSEISWVRRIDG